MNKLPRRYSGIVMGAIMAVCMGSIMSFVVTAINLGFGGNFLKSWMLAFVGALPVGFPIALVVTPIVKAFIDRITESVQ